MSRLSLKYPLVMSAVIWAGGMSTGVMVSNPAAAQIRPESSGEPSFDEPSMRPHHRGMFYPNEAGQPRVGYRFHRRHHRYRVR